MAEFEMTGEQAAAIRASLAEKEAAKATYEAVVRQANDTIDATNRAMLGGLAVHDIVWARPRRSDPQPMLVATINVHRSWRFDPDDNTVSVHLLCRRATKAGHWSLRDEYIEEWEPFTGDDADLPSSLPTDLVPEDSRP